MVTCILSGAVRGLVQLFATKKPKYSIHFVRTCKWFPCSIAKNKFQLCQWKCKAEPLKMLHCGHEIRLPCAQQIDKSITCTALINYTLPCHHMVTIRCSEQEIKAQGKCKIKCGSPVDGGHYCSLPCHDRRTVHACKETVSKQLRCGHTKVQFLCCNICPVELFKLLIFIILRTCRVSVSQAKKYALHPYR